MLVAYFDESGIHGSEAEVTTVAGFIGHTLEWADLEFVWKKKIFPNQCFHAAECQNKHKTLFVELAGLIAERRLIPIAGAVRRDDWNYCSSRIVKERLPTPYHAALMMAFIQALNFIKNHYPSEFLSFVFATCPQYDHYVREVHDVLINDNKHWGNIGSLSFGCPQELIPLQAADLYSYENYQELISQNTRLMPPKPIRPALKIINQMTGMESRIATVEMLHRMSEEHEAIQ